MLTNTEPKVRGFTLMEVMVTLAIIAIMVAVMLPSLSSRMRTSNSSNLSQNLKTINDGIQKYRENVGYFPSQLALLVTKPTTSNTDACGTTLSTTDVNGWQGPYIALTATSNGIQSGDAVIRNTVTRSPATTSSSTVMDGTLSIIADGVTSSQATDVETILDAGASDFNAGTVRYSSTGLFLTYVIPISGC